MYETCKYGQTEDALVQEMLDQICGCIEVILDLQAVENKIVGKHPDLSNSNCRLLSRHVRELHVGVVHIFVGDYLLK